MPQKKEAKINIDLWPSGAWTETQLRKFIELFQEFGPTSGQISRDMRGVELQIFITVAASAVAAGFFGKLGSDLYEFVKARLKKILLKSENEASEIIDLSGCIGSLTFFYHNPELRFSRVYYVCRYSQASHLDAFFSYLQQVDNLIRKARNSQKFPFDRGRSYDIAAWLKTSPLVSWDVRVRRYEEKNERLILNEFFHSRFHISELEKLEWEQIKWVKGITFIV